MSSLAVTIQPIILCGGSGTRLWPLSTSKIPKQFISLGKRGTLLEETLRRVSRVMEHCQSGVSIQGSNKHYITSEPLLIMHHSHKLPPELWTHEANVVYENYANDTAVAIARAALEIKNRHPNGSVIMLVLPADHYIYNTDAFVRDIAEGIDHVTTDNIVLYGIDPIRPETKYGYIIPSNDSSSEIGVTFKEKPSMTLALELINHNALWNSGIFAADTDLILECIQKSSYNIMDWIQNAREGKTASFDVAVLQEYKNIYAHHCSGWRWSDVGTWDAFTDIPEIKDEMNSNTSSIILNECTNIDVLKRSPGTIVLIGCQDLRVVTNGSDILIMSNQRDYNNQLKDIATRLYS